MQLLRFIDWDPPAAAAGTGAAAACLSPAGYYAARERNARTGDWTSTTARAMQGKTREHLLPFLRRLGFFRQ